MGESGWVLCVVWMCVCVSLCFVSLNCSVCLHLSRHHANHTKSIYKCPSLFFTNISLISQFDGEDNSLKKAAKDLQTLMEELRMTEAEMKMSNPDEDKFDLLCKWLKKGGAQFPKLYLQYYSDDYRGCHSLTKVRCSQTCLFFRGRSI